ncbi:MAG: hypothetical protein IT580_12660 [Verrucomicrobiales bacterium]|nr:hypothetical protein [Verrucomicrobiales bacterium]
MNATRILPDLQCSLLCDEVRQEVSGNFILLGIIAYVRVPQLPITALKLCVFNRWTAGVGQFTETVRLVAPDEAVVRQSQVRFALQDATHNATNVTLFTQVEFKVAGTYYIEVLVDDVMKLRFPVPVHLVQQPAAGAGQQPQRPNPKGPDAPQEGA